MQTRRGLCAALALLVAVAAVAPGLASRSLLDSKSYKIDLVNTFAKGKGNDVVQEVDVELRGPDQLPTVADPDNPMPVKLDPNNPKCDMDHEFAYPTFMLTDKPIGPTDTENSSKKDDDDRRRLLGKDDDSDSSEEKDDDKDSDKDSDESDFDPELIPMATYQIFVGTDFQVKPVFIGHLTGGKSANVRVDGSGASTVLKIDKDVPKRTFCGDWVYSPSGRYQWQIGVEDDAEAALYYYVKMAPGSSMETYAKMPVNLDYKHEYTVAGSDNEVISSSILDTGAHGGRVTVTLDNVVAGADNYFEQVTKAGSN